MQRVVAVFLFYITPYQTLTLFKISLRKDKLLFCFLYSIKSSILTKLKWAWTRMKKTKINAIPLGFGGLSLMIVESWISLLFSYCEKAERLQKVEHLLCPAGSIRLNATLLTQFTIFNAGKKKRLKNNWNSIENNLIRFLLLSYLILTRIILAKFKRPTKNYKLFEIPEARIFL